MYRKKEMRRDRFAIRSKNREPRVLILREKMSTKVAKRLMKKCLRAPVSIAISSFDSNDIVEEVVERINLTEITYNFSTSKEVGKYFLHEFYGSFDHVVNDLDLADLLIEAFSEVVNNKIDQVIAKK